MNPFFACEINEMSEDVARGRAHERGGGFGVNPAREVIGAGGTVCEGGENLCLAAQTVFDQPVEAGICLSDGGAVACVEGGPALCIEAVARLHEIGEVAIGGRDQ